MNPFEKRATEYLRDDEAFLAVVTPEPLEAFFEKKARNGTLYDRLAIIIGTPGSGKTTLARLFQYQTLHTLLRNRGIDAYKPLVDTLTKCGAISEGSPVYVGCRLPLEAEYRDFWEFPYPEDLKSGLMTALLQARAVLAWIRNLTESGISEAKIKIIPRQGSEAALTTIGGVNAKDLVARAREVELAVYQVSAALLPPTIDEIDKTAAMAYRPFDVIESFQVNDDINDTELRPLVIFDDAHSLHRDQFSALQRWLARRELKVARWILTRIDALCPADVLTEARATMRDSEPGLKRSREITEIWLQSGTERAEQRRSFRKMAKDMSSRYLRQMEVFNRRGLHSLGNLLTAAPSLPPKGIIERLSKQVDATQKKHNITSQRRAALEKKVSQYFDGPGDKSKSNSEDVRLATLKILMERYSKRVPQKSLFSDDDTEPARPITVDSGVVDGAQVYLMHKFDRPYFFGIDSICDASSENAEQFLQLTAKLVSQMETQIIRSRPPSIDSSTQHKLLREKASTIIKDWDFPQHQSVRQIANGIARECIEKSLEPNASLGGGAIAFGIPQEEFDSIPQKHPGLAQALQYGVAYNVFKLVQNYGTKKKRWCLIELGGISILHHGLTLHRGGFLERSAEDLEVLHTSRDL